MLFKHIGYQPSFWRFLVAQMVCVIERHVRQSRVICGYSGTDKLSGSSTLKVNEVDIQLVTVGALHDQSFGLFSSLISF